jgi:hypothetical protein
MISKGKRTQEYCTIAEAMERVKHLEDLCSRMPSLYGYRSSDIPKAYRRLVSLCTSLSIVFLQYDLLPDAFSLLKTAAVADLHLTADSSASTWTARVLIYNCYAYLFEKYFSSSL